MTDKPLTVAEMESLPDGSVIYGPDAHSLPIAAVAYSADTRGCRWGATGDDQWHTSATLHTWCDWFLLLRAS